MLKLGNLLKSLAPTVAQAAGGPLASMAVKMVAQVKMEHGEEQYELKSTDATHIEMYGNPKISQEYNSKLE